MYVFRSGSRAAGIDTDSADTPRSRRVGWWGLGPAIYGAGFLILGVAMLAGSGAVGPGASGLVISGVVFVVIGVLALALAWWIRRDILSDDAPPRDPAELDAMADAELRVTGVQGSARITSFKYVGGSTSDGTTLVQLGLDVTTALGGTIQLQPRVRVPLVVTEKLAKGATVPVIVSSTDPSRLIIEWTGLAAPTA